MGSHKLTNVATGTNPSDAVRLDQLTGGYQPVDATLTAWAALTFAANKLAYGTGADAFSLTDFTAAGRSMVGAADAAAQTALLSALVGDSGSGGTKGLVPAPSTGDGTYKKALLADASYGMAHVAPDIILEDQQTSGTAGGTATSGADRTRVLNTEVRDVFNICSLSSNQFTISVAGTYYVEWSSPAANVDGHQSMLYDVTGTAVLKRGESAFASNAGSDVVNRSAGCHVVTISGSNVFEIRHRVTTTLSTLGFGNATSLGTELYTWVKIWKIA